MKKRFVSIFLTISMICTLIPALGITASAAAKGVVHTHNNVVFSTEIGDLAALQALFETGGNGYLTADVQIPDSTVLVAAAEKTVTLCLNGKTVTFGKGSRFNIYGAFNLYGYEGGTITGGYCSNGGTAYVYSGGIFNMYSGTIQNSTAYGTTSGNGLGGAIYIQKGGTFNMYDGTIKDCTAQRFAGAVESYGVFNIYGGTIDNCKANSNYGGGVEIESSGTFNMNGGTISNCKAMNTTNSGKGGAIAAAGVCTMNGGTITGCTAYNGGGGVHVYKGYTFTMNGGTITKCSADHGGGVNNAGTFTMNGGFIDACTSSIRGGGVYGWDGGSFIFNGGTIQNCTAPNEGRGAGLCLINAKATMTGGIIRNNKTGSSAHGGGVYVYGGNVEWNGKSVPTAAQFTMSGGEISGNYANWSGGGVFCENYGSFLMTGGTIKDNSSGSYGSGVGVYQSKTSTGNAISWIYIKGGTISNNKVRKDTAGRAMMWTQTVTGSGSCDYNGSSLSNTNVSTYDALKTAVSNAPTDGTPVAITLTANLTDTGDYALTIPYTSNIVLNLNGYSITRTTASPANSLLYVRKCPFYLVNTATAQSKVTGGKYALRLNNEGDGTWGNLKAHVIGNISIGSAYTAGGTWLFRDTANVSISSPDYKKDSHRLYKVTLDPNGGSGAPGKAPDTELGAINSLYLHGLYKSSDGTLTLPTTAPNREGYTLKGWNTAANGSGTDYGFKYNNGNGVVATLYAQWSQNQTLTYDANGHGIAPKAVTMTYDAATYAEYGFTGDVGYTFAGWNTKPDGTGTAYAAGEQIKAANDDPAAMTLYAQWAGNTYPVTLDNGEGSGETSVTATYGAAMPKVTPPTWDKHVFQGYFTQQGEAYYDANGESVKAWDQDSDSVTLYAHWADSAKIEDLSLELDGDIGMRFHSTVNEEALKTGYMTMSVGGKAAKTQTVHYNETEKDSTGKAIFSFDVSAIELAEKITANFYDENGTLYDTASESVEDYYGLLKEDAKVAADAKAVVKALVNYGHFAQQALSKTRGWVIGSDYAATAKQNDLTATAEDLKAYSPIIIGNDDHVKGIGMSLLLDNKTTLCLYFTTSDGEMPRVRVDGGGELIPIEYDETANVAPQYIEHMSDGRWLVRIPNIDAVNLGTIHKVTADGRTIYLSALSYGSVITGEENINAICALYEYYQAALQYAKLQEITSATAQDASYNGSAIEPQLTVMSGDTQLTDSAYQVEWLGNLTDVGTHIGIVRAKSGNLVGGALVQFTVKQ